MHELNIQEHYEKSGMADSVLAAIQDALSDTKPLKLEDFPPVDEFHIRGREATLEMIKHAQFGSDDHVLDVGCGVGGPSRWLARLSGCKVSGLDITETFCTIARSLARHTGMQHQVQYFHGSALDMPFETDSFDGVWMQHVNMNIEDKSGFFLQCHRVLKPGAKLVFYEIIADSTEPLEFPVPWARRPDISFLVTETVLRDLLAARNLVLQSWSDVTATAHDYFRQLVQQSKHTAGQAGVPIHAAKNSAAAPVLVNMLQNFEHGRVRVVNGIATA